MSYQNPKIAQTAELLQKRLQKLDDKATILRATELKALYDELPLLPNDQKAAFGKELNQLKAALAQAVNSAGKETEKLESIDVTAPFDEKVNNNKPRLLSADHTCSGANCSSSGAFVSSSHMRVFSSESTFAI